MRRTLTALAALATLAMPAGVAHAAAGELDPTFGDGGSKLLPFFAQPETTIVQPDGKIVLVGEYVNGGDFVAWRLNFDGSLDRTFSGDGAATIDFGADENASAAALQADGRLVIAGSTVADGVAPRVALARLDPDGSLDETFDPGGADGDGKKVLADATFLYAEAVAVRPDGKIVVGGGGYGDFELARLSREGAVEKRFEAADFGGSEGVEAAALTADGGVVAAGTTFPSPGAGTDPDIAVARYTPEGKLDETLAGTGKTTVGPDGYEDVAGLLVHPDGGLTVAGTAGAGGPDPKMFAIRLRRAGAVDANYGAGGTAVANFDAEDDAVDAALQRDGKVIVAGTAYSSEAPSISIGVGRFGASGALDASFGSGGLSTLTIGDYSQAMSAALQPDGKLLIAGAALEGIVPRTFVARLQADPLPTPGGAGGPGATPRMPRCAGRRATIVGTARRDKLRGTRRADVIVALGGGDRIRALGGNDRVCAGRGNDVVAGAGGRDTLRGDAGRDRLRGGPGRDRLLGGRGRDRLIGGPGRDALRHGGRR